jgi:hypothetical protein
MSTTNTNKAPAELRRENYYRTRPDLVLIRIPFLTRTFQALETLASQTGVSVPEMVAVLIGPVPRFALREIMEARGEALGNRREQLEKDRKEKR